MARHDDAQAKAAQRKSVKADKLQHTLRQMAVRSLLSTIEGRAYLWWLLEIGRYGIQPFAADAGRTAFNCGELNVGMQILANILETEPAGFIRLQQEHQNVPTEPDTPDSSNTALDAGPDSADSSDAT